MKLSGVSLPISSVIIIALCILVLVALAIYFVHGSKSLATTEYENAFSRGCDIYLKTFKNPEDIILDDVNNDAIPDSLLTVCRLYFSNPEMNSTECADKCRERFWR